MRSFIGIAVPVLAAIGLTGCECALAQQPAAVPSRQTTSEPQARERLPSLLIRPAPGRFVVDGWREVSVAWIPGLESPPSWKLFCNDGNETTVGRGTGHEQTACLCRTLPESASAGFDYLFRPDETTRTITVYCSRKADGPDCGTACDGRK